MINRQQGNWSPSPSMAGALTFVICDHGEVALHAWHIAHGTIMWKYVAYFDLSYTELDKLIDDFLVRLLRIRERWDRKSPEADTKNISNARKACLIVRFMERLLKAAAESGDDISRDYLEQIVSGIAGLVWKILGEDERASSLICELVDLYIDRMTSNV